MRGSHRFLLYPFRHWGGRSSFFFLPGGVNGEEYQILMSNSTVRQLDDNFILNIQILYSGKE